MRATGAASPSQLAMPHHTTQSTCARGPGSRHGRRPGLLLLACALLCHAAASHACAVFRLGPSGFVAQSILLFRLWPLLSANGTVYIDSSIFNYRCSDNERGGWHEFFETAPLVTWTERLENETRGCPHLNGVAAVTTIIGSRIPPQLLLAEGVSQVRPLPNSGPSVDVVWASMHARSCPASAHTRQGSCTPAQTGAQTRADLRTRAAVL